jgi:predicted membrane protein
MTESKIKKLIIASTVGAVLLAIILLSIMIYQLIAIGVENQRIKDLNAQLDEIDMLIDEGIDIKEARLKKEWIEYEARKLGYIFEGDRIIK